MKKEDKKNERKKEEKENPPPKKFKEDKESSVIKKCEHCEGKNDVTVTCVDCKENFCTSCFEKIHKAGNLKTHEKKAFQEGIDKKEEEMKPKCLNHPTSYLKFYCFDCDKELCSDCVYLNT